MRLSTIFFTALLLFICPFSLLSQSQSSQLIFFEKGDLQQLIDEAPQYAEIRFDRNIQHTLSTPLLVRKPLILRGLNLLLPDSLGDTPLLEVEAAHVVITDFVMTGNAATVSQQERAPLLVIKANDFTVERGQFYNSSKEGISIEADTLDVVGGVVRDILGRGVMRDLVSINGGYNGKKARNILVENIRNYQSALRGAVEVSNGTDNITVRKVFAQECAYAVDVQDHRNDQQVNQYVVLEDIYALDCRHAIRTANIPIGHHNLSIRNVTAERCTRPLQISHTDMVSLEGVRILDHPEGEYPPLDINNCEGLSISDVKVRNSDFDGPALLIKDSEKVVVDGLMLMDENSALTQAVHYLLSSGEAFSGLKITNVVAPHFENEGILLSVTEKGGKLSDYLISGNLCTVKDEIQSASGTVRNNLGE